MWVLYTSVVVNGHGGNKCEEQIARKVLRTVKGWKMPRQMQVTCVRYSREIPLDRPAWDQDDCQEKNIQILSKTWVWINACSRCLSSFIASLNSNLWISLTTQNTTQNTCSNHMVRHPRCVFINYNWINQLSNTTIWWLDICFYYIGINYMFRLLWPSSGWQIDNKLLRSYILACVLCMVEGGWGWMGVRDLVCVE